MLKSHTVIHTGESIAFMLMSAIYRVYDFCISTCDVGDLITDCCSWVIILFRVHQVRQN